MDDLFDISGNVILVTGSTGGIGRALAEGYAERGAKVVINGRDEARVASETARLTALGHSATGAVFDVTDPQAVDEGVKSIEAEIGPIAALINNAGIQHRQALEDFDNERWDALLATNVSSAFYVGKAVARHMISRRSGKIINIASVQTELARPGIAPYAATKGAIRNLTRGMCADWARYGLQANAIAPGYFRTDLNAALVADPAFTKWLEARTPAARWGNVGELVGVAVFLASNASSFVNGQTIFVDGGITASV
ncbi:SDR family oxidoreductase [Paracoccus onubensis]|uniref:SDR family oxidoreductase n=1 Tax=Paracoccus onubensis TaxID=1675788 RepID=A0A418SN40_9RHOB|nr:SDR family oxidoreductase [Paracoccus onubensis]RJE82364.1 SDR family oxidoreductase [Paracoccus onubensis]